MTANKMLELVNSADFSRVTDFAARLIRQSSLSGREKPVVELCLREAQALGFLQAGADALGNFIGRVQVGDGRGPKILLSGHLDVVNADPAEWSADTGPWSGAIKQGRLYGRGASDMKGAVACMLHAAALCAKLPADGFSGQVFFSGTVVEELFEGVCFLEVLRAIKPDYVIIGEATECRINIGQRGRGEAVVAVHGIPRHASSGRETINPIEQAAAVIDAFHRFYRPAEDSLLGRRDIVPTDIKIPVGGGGGLDGRGGNSTVPNRVEINYDVRLHEGDTIESICRLMRDQLRPMEAEGRLVFPPGREVEIYIADDSCTTYTGIQLRQPKFAPAWKTPADSELVRGAQAGLEAAGLPVKLGAYRFCTDGSALVAYRREQGAGACQVIGFGPSRENLAHVVDEYVELDELRRAWTGYAMMAAELLRR